MKISKSILEKMFVEYNKKCFDCSLILPNISTYIGETSMGIFKVIEGTYTKYMKISIARNFNLTKEELRDLLIHEMIHEYVYLKSGKVSHNRMFKKKMKEINKKYGFDIRKNSRHLFKKYKKKKNSFKKFWKLYTCWRKTHFIHKNTIIKK